MLFFVKYGQFDNHSKNLSVVESPDVPFYYEQSYGVEDSVYSFLFRRHEMNHPQCSFMKSRLVILRFTCAAFVKGGQIENSFARLTVSD